MGFRVEAPGGKKGKDGLPVLVLPEETVLRENTRRSTSPWAGCT
ncbi:MAG: hypothetical protein RDV48_27345 [Candidatus Eremiobacteraeota bacterium]|nr:hypothetical protein [Candidatus Eremiobacteraeota bacterium]